MSLNRLCLVINASYEAINVTSARRALTLVFKGAAVVEEVSGYTIRTSKINIPVPSVVRLMKYRRMPRQNRSVSRKGILLRDGSSCQYCGARLPSGSLTLDHVVPRSRRGLSTWENLVACCFACNNKKGDRYAAGSRHGAGQTASADQHSRQAQVAGRRCPYLGQVPLRLTRV
jgi:5-methylcytosine-specific restriction endonuclease McrA